MKNLTSNVKFILSMVIGVWLICSGFYLTYWVGAVQANRLYQYGYPIKVNIGGCWIKPPYDDKGVPNYDWGTCSSFETGIKGRSIND